MTEVLELIKAANGITPLGLSALLAVIIWMLVRGKKSVAAQVRALGDNHLHSVPDIAANMERIVDTLQRIELKLGENFAAIHVKLGDK